MLPAINSVNMMTWDGHIFSLVGYREIKKMSYFGSDAASSLWVWNKMYRLIQQNLTDIRAKLK